MSLSRKLDAEEQSKLSLLSPMWQKIARGEIDLSQYTDDEILSGKMKMPDGRKTPEPRVYPQTFIDEQVKRGMRVAERKIREGAQEALNVYSEIMKDKKASNRDRMQASQFFFERRYGKEPVSVKVATVDKIEQLFASILEDPDGLEAPEVER